MNKKLMDLDQLKQYKIELVSTKENALYVKDVLISLGADGMNLPPIPVTAIKNFIEGKRDNLWEITINGIVRVTVKGEKDAAEVLLTLLDTADKDVFDMEPLQLSNIESFIANERENVAQFEMVHNPVAKPKEEELPGHLD